MAEEVGRKLALGFLGGDQAKRENALALLDDLIATYHRNNKGAEVVFYLSADPFTHTMADLADYAVTSGYKIGLVGSDEDLAMGAVKPFLADAEGRLHRVTKGKYLPDILVNTLSVFSPESRLILLANPDEDDDAYNAVAAADEKKIKVRSLLDGLDEVTLEIPDSEEETIVPPEPEAPELPAEEEYEDPEDLEGIPEPDLEEEGNVIDPEDDIVDAELVGEEGNDEVPLEISADEVPSDPAVAEEPAAEPEEEEPVAAATTENTPAAVSKVVKATKTAKKTAANKSALDADNLIELAATDRIAFYELAARYKIYPGKGIKIPNMVNRILVASGGEPVATPKKVTAPKKAAAKKAPAAVKAPAKKAVAKKAPAAKKTARTQRAAAASPRVASGGPWPKQEGPSPKAVKAATKLVEAALLLLSE